MKDFESYESPVADKLGLEAVINGLASDLNDLRGGKISVPDALARAALGKQVFNGCRLYLVAIQTIESAARDVTPKLPANTFGNGGDA